MASTAPRPERALLALHAVVIAVLLTAGIVGAVQVGGRSSNKVAAGAAQPSLGPQLVPGAPPASTSTSLPPVPTTVPQPAVVASGVSTGFGGSQSVATSTTRYFSSTTLSPSTTEPTCTASVSDPTPQPGQKESVAVVSDLDSATVTVTVHYASGDAMYKAKTSSSGQAQVSFTIPSRELPGSVAVDALVGGRERCQTSFTVV